MTDLAVTRVFDAPVSQVWNAWTDGDHVKRWWGPAGFTAPVARMDVREGGSSLVCMRSPDGHDLYNTWTYQAIEPNERLEFILRFTDSGGTPVSPAEIGLPPDIPDGVRHVITFKAVDEGRTEMTVTEYGYTSDQTVEMSRAGLEQTLDKMAASL
jgi:uncharacterized protein YndB with AHSA1/START domain